MDDEASKLRKHLELLREEYVKLQARLSSVEKKYQVAVANAGLHAADDDNFVARLLRTVAELFDKPLYSDLKLELPGRTLYGHRFVLAARSDTWGVPDLGHAETLDLTDVEFDVGHALLKWVYTDEIDVQSPDDSFLLALLKAARRFRLLPLSDQCEQSLMSSVTVSNCIRYYQTAEEIGADILKDHCSQLISTHWNDFTSSDFESMPASLAYTMFKSKSEYPLHTAVRTKREDVVFLYLVENDAHLPAKLDEVDNRGDVALDLALRGEMEDMAKTLVKHGASVNRVDASNVCLLHKAISRGDEFSSIFLLDHSADVKAVSGDTRVTALHLTALTDPKASGAEVLTGMANVARKLLSKGAQINAQDTDGNTALHSCVHSFNEAVFSVLLEDGNMDWDLQNRQGETALWLALQHRPIVGEHFTEESLAGRLIKRGASVNSINSINGDSLLHMCARSQQEEAGLFLVSHSANANWANSYGETPLHTSCQHGLATLSQHLLQSGANPNAQTSTVLPGAPSPEEEEVEEEVEEVVEQQVPASPSPPTQRPQAPTSLALNHRVELNPFAEDDSPFDNTNPFDTSNPFAEDKPKPESPKFQQNISQKLKVDKQKTVMTTIKTKRKKKVKRSPLCRQTPLHVAITHKNRHVVQVFLTYKAEVTKSGSNLQIIPNFGVKDSHQQTVLGLALWQGYHDIALQLIQGGASVSEPGEEGRSLLLQAIERRDADSALFLLNNNADPNARTGLVTCLCAAIEQRLVSVVRRLCEKGANMNHMEGNGQCPLWLALTTGQLDAASILVEQGCDRDMWGPGPGGCQQTLLHRAIDENNDAASCFLVRSQCDVNSPRRPGPNGEGGEEAKDGQTPLHQSSTWGQDTVVQCLLELNADVNAQDSEGKTPLHVAIENQHNLIISLLMSHPSLNVATRDKSGMTPFTVAMATKNNKAAQAILEREPSAAEQYDSRGRTFLHIAINKVDVESVLFLISVHVSVNSPTADASRLTPLHLAVNTGNDFIVRNLLLAGVNVNDMTPQKQTALHLAADKDQASIVSVLLENHANFDKLDDAHNNALHLACQHGHLNTCRSLLTESQINAEAINIKGQNPLHCLGQYGKESAAAIYELFMECMPNFPIDKPDANGNTVLLLAYFNGNGHLCRAVVRSGAALGVVNKDGVSIFNAPVATKQLLFKLLDMLSNEPPWTEGETCLECGVKFGIRTRKHHCLKVVTVQCDGMVEVEQPLPPPSRRIRHLTADTQSRHCGRLLCAKCSGKDMPIIKYNITSPVRVCDICFDVLTMGTS